MRILSWNIENGGADRFEAQLEVLRATVPDVVVLQECLGWDDGHRLASVAAALDIPPSAPHTFLAVANARGSGRRFHVGLVSRTGLHQRVTHTDGVAHVVAEAVVDLGTAPLALFGVHLVWSDEDARMLEVERLMSWAEPVGLALLAGDLNALTRADPYPSDVDERLRRAGIDKYGHPPRFDVTDRLRDAGWIDALQPAAEARSQDPNAWVTARRKRGEEGAVVDARSDYVLVSPALWPRVARAAVLDVGSASDHQAIIVDIV